MVGGVTFHKKRTELFIITQRSIESYIENCFDAIGLFLCIHVDYRYQAILHKRKISCLEELVASNGLYYKFFDRYSEELQSYLWPRFRHILNLNVASVRDADPHKLGHIDTRPHYVSETWPPLLLTFN